MSLGFKHRNEGLTYDFNIQPSNFGIYHPNLAAFLPCFPFFRIEKMGMSYFRFPLNIANIGDVLGLGDDGMCL